MISLKKALAQAKKNKVAIAHFNFSELTTLHACFDAARELSKAHNLPPIPLIFGLSEGERAAIGLHEGVAMVRQLRK